jgi:hypothetical protein
VTVVPLATKQERAYKHVWQQAVMVSDDLDAETKVMLWRMGEEWMGPDGMNCYPSQETIAEVVGCARETVNRRLGKAEAAGFLVREYRPDRHGRERLHFTPLLPGGCDVPVTGDCDAGVTQTQTIEPEKTAAPTAQTAPGRSRRRGKPERIETPPVDELMISDPEPIPLEATIGADVVEGIDAACERAGVVVKLRDKRRMYQVLEPLPPDARADVLYRLEIRSRPDLVIRPGEFMLARVRQVADEVWSRPSVNS